MSLGAKFSYALLRCSVVLDNARSHRFITDALLSEDDISLGFNKTTFDSVDVSDQNTILISKAITEDLIAKDQLNILTSFLRDFASTASMEELMQFILSKPISDSASVQDTLTSSFSKALEDQLLFSETVRLQFDQSLVEGVELLDGMAFVLNAEWAEQFGVSDASFFVFAKVLVEAVTVEDEAILSQDKLLTDGVAMNDGLEAEDGLNFTLAQSFNNMSFMADNAVVNFLAAQSDLVYCSDGGFIFVQDYCDDSYFSESYVGEVVFNF